MGFLPPKKNKTGAVHLDLDQVRNRLGYRVTDRNRPAPAGEGRPEPAAAPETIAPAPSKSPMPAPATPPETQVQERTEPPPPQPQSGRAQDHLEAPEPIPVPVDEPRSPSEARWTLASLPFRGARQALSDSDRFSRLMRITKESASMPRQLLLLSFFANLTGLALPLAILQIYDRILTNQSYSTLTLLTAGLIGVFILEAALKIFRSYLLGWAAVNHGFTTQINAVLKLLKAPRRQSSRHPATVWVDSFDALGELSAFEGSESRLVLIDIPMATIFLLVIALVGGPLVFVPVAMILGIGSFTIRKGLWLFDSLAARSEQDRKQADFLVECLSGIHTIKGLAIEPQILRRFERLQKVSSLVSYDTTLTGAQLHTYGVLFSNLLMVSVVTTGALLVMAGHLTIGALACCSLLSGRLTQPVLRATAMWAEIQKIQLAEQRSAQFDELQIPDRVEPDAPLRGCITLDRVCYGSGEVGARALDGVSLAVGAGEFVGLRRGDGSAPSAVAGLLLGDVAPQQGRVMIDDVAASDLRRLGLNRQMSYVTAKLAVFTGSVLDNITMFQTGDAVAAAQDAARLIGLESDINLLPAGYDTIIGQGVAETLSSGLLQKIMIARALARKPKILIFHEANSLLDFKSDRLLREGLLRLKGDVTTVVISNRPSLLQITDRCFELREGKIYRIDPSVGPAKAPVEQSVA